MIPKPHKDTIKKENYRPIFLINIDAEIINKMIANRIQNYIKKIIDHDQVGIISEKYTETYRNKFNPSYQQTKRQNHIIISLNAEKTFNKNLAPLHN